MGRKGKQGRRGAAAEVAQCDAADINDSEATGETGAAPEAIGGEGSCDEADKCGAEGGAADLRLAVALSDFLQARCPEGLPFGSLAGPEVRQGLKRLMQEAGVRSFKAKWLQRFPEQLIYDTKTKSVRAAPAVAAAAAAIREAAAEVDSKAADSDAELERPAAATGVRLETRRSCLRGKASTEGESGSREGLKLCFTELVDTLLFKVGHEPTHVVSKGQHMQRPMAASDDSEDKGGAGQSDVAPRRLAGKAAKEAWLNPSLLPPVDDDGNEE